MANEVLFEVRDRIAFITLNRPHALNAINKGLWEGMVAAWERVRDDPDIWTAIVTGTGDRAFSAGADLKEMAEEREARDAEKPHRIFRWELPSPLRDFHLWKPVIAAINGYCLAGGLEMALACDIRIATEHATFGLAEVKRAIIPSGGGTQRLPRFIPFGMALEILFTGDAISAQEALRLGLVNRVVPLSELMPTAEALARRINENGPLAVRAIKESAYRGLNMSLDEGLRLEALLGVRIHTTLDSKEGPRAFAERRKANYKGW